MRVFINLCLFTLILSTFAEAEIQRVTVRWTALSCDRFCAANLETQFRKIPGVANVVINQGAGQADLTYYPNAPFSFDPLNYALAAIGLPAMDVRVRARGMIQHSAQVVYLISQGDNTTFTLLNPVIPDMTGQAAEFNILARYLRPPLLQKLLQAQAQQQIATIEGPLFMPERGFVSALVVEQLSLAPPKD